MRTHTKPEILRRTILPQEETIRGLRFKAQSLTAENKRLRADARRAGPLCREYRRLIAGIQSQRDRYASLDSDMKKMIHKLRKAVNLT